MTIADMSTTRVQPHTSPVPVLILCGGQGTRIRDVADNLPKPMIEIGGRPILWHIMKGYAHYGFHRFLLCLGYKGQAIKDFFLNYDTTMNDFTITLGPKPHIRVRSRTAEAGWRISLHDTGLTAQTGARVRRGALAVQGRRFLLTYGDGVADVDISAVYRFHLSQRKLITITGVRPPGRFGEIEVRGDQVVAFKEKPQASGGLINGGFMVVERAFVDRYLPDRDDLVLEREPLFEVARDGQMAVYRHEGFWQPMDTYREWLLLNELWNTERAPWKVW